jgi:hypothetical protein
LGTSQIPMRFMATPELTVITLKGSSSWDPSLTLRMT